jgi:hypothetical protein
MARKLWTIALAAAVAIAAVTLVLSRSPAPGSVSGNPPQIPPGERLLPQLTFVISHAGDDPVPQIPFFEVAGDGWAKPLSLTAPSHGAIEEFLPMPDGRVLVRASQDLAPEVPRQDGPWAGGIAFPLMVVESDGAVVSNHDIRRLGEDAGLLAVSATQGFLLRTKPGTAEPGRVVAHDLATGAERIIAETNQAMGHADVSGDVFVFAAKDEALGCAVQVITLSAGPHSRTSVPACESVAEVNVSPDGRFAAIVYERAAEPELRIRILDLRNGDVFSDELIGTPQSCTECIATAASGGFLGTTWLGPATVRVTQMQPLPIKHDKAHVLAEVQKRLHHRNLSVPTPQ